MSNYDQEYKGYRIVESTHGSRKATSLRKISTIKVQAPADGDGYFVKAEVRFFVNKYGAKQRAIAKAKRFVDEITRRKEVDEQA